MKKIFAVLIVVLAVLAVPAMAGLMPDDVENMEPGQTMLTGSGSGSYAAVDEAGYMWDSFEPHELNSGFNVNADDYWGGAIVVQQEAETFFEGDDYYGDQPSEGVVTSDVTRTYLESSSQGFIATAEDGFDPENPASLTIVMDIDKQSYGAISGQFEPIVYAQNFETDDEVILENGPELGFEFSDYAMATVPTGEGSYNEQGSFEYEIAYVSEWSHDNEVEISLETTSPLFVVVDIPTNTVEPWDGYYPYSMAGSSLQEVAGSTTSGVTSWTWTNGATYIDGYGSLYGAFTNAVVESNEVDPEDFGILEPDGVASLVNGFEPITFVNIEVDGNFGYTGGTFGLPYYF
jgi:hypothetical protein